MKYKDIEKLRESVKTRFLFLGEIGLGGKLEAGLGRVCSEAACRAEASLCSAVIEKLCLSVHWEAGSEDPQTLSESVRINNLLSYKNNRHRYAQDYRYQSKQEPGQRQPQPAR